MLIEDGVARGRAAGGEWQTLEGFTDAFAPGGDVAAYLLAARHVTDLGRERRELPALGAALTIQRYHFAVDGPALTAYLTEQLEVEMRRKGELPPDMRLDFGNAFRQIAGSGEAWLDEDGLPLRWATWMRSRRRS